MTDFTFNVLEAVAGSFWNCVRKLTALVTLVTLACKSVLCVNTVAPSHWVCSSSPNSPASATEEPPGLPGNSIS